MRLAAACLSLACATPAVADVPRVITDTPVVHSLVSQVMGTLGEPALLMDRGSDPHSFQMRPRQAAELSEANIVFWVGEELTPWLARSLENLAGDATTIALLEAEGVELREYGEDLDDHAHDDHKDHDDHGHDHAHDDHDHGHDDHAHDNDHGHEDHAHDHDGVDPHAWLYPDNAKAWVSAIASGLSAADPENASTYARNAETAIAGITAAETATRETLADLSGPIVVFHDAYAYFADAFDVEIAGSIALGDAAAPSVQRLRELQETIGASDIACVFQEPQHDGSIARAVADDAGLGLGMLDPSGTTLDPGTGLYAALLTRLAQEITSCANAAG